jgi:hypothetical protein
MHKTIAAFFILIYLKIARRYRKVKGEVFMKLSTSKTKEIFEENNQGSNCRVASLALATACRWW